jgi:hypothetical protein
MASDRSQYNRALRKWDELHEAQKYSIPSDDGCVAILWSDYVLNDDERVAFEEDAYLVSGDFAGLGIESQIFPAYTLNDASKVLQHPEMTHIITIGNGNLSTSYAHDGGRFDWQFVSRYSSHLKTGRFVQRHCGQPIRELSVPLGTFAMARHSDVYAAYGRPLPTRIAMEDEQNIVQLHPYRRIGYRAVKNSFTGIRLPKPDETTSEDLSTEHF